MPSRQLLQSSPSTSDFPDHHHNHHLLIPILAATLCFFSLLLLFLLYLRTLNKKPATPPPDSNPPQRLSYSLLRRATNSFSTRLGHGGFGTVFAGTLPAGKPVAVKQMDSASYQGEREFHNELFFASKLRSPHVVTAVGFSSDPKRRRFLLVYDLMENGNLQDALLHRKCPELMDWNTRFKIALDIARGVQYLHTCDPPAIHGDIKPSNILLDRDFVAKIGDFGLARLTSEPHFEVLAGDGDEEKKEEEEVLACEVGVGVGVDDCGSLVEETESVKSLNTGFFEEGSLGLEQSPDGFVRVPISETSPETMAMASLALDKASIQSEKDDAKKNGKGLKSNSMRDWWVGKPVGESKKVKDYVMDWIGKEVNKERPKSEWVEEAKLGKERKRRKHQLEWWESMEEEKVKKPKRRPVREWWKEECDEELARKKKKKKQTKRNGVNSDDDNGGDWWVSDDALYGDKKKSKRTSRNNRGSVDWWLDGMSGELWKARRNSYDSAASEEIPKSGGVSSTPSMRGTVCYVAPEYGYGGDVSEKCDVYSFGVLLLVVISGRRPLQVNGSPMSEFQRANLLTWTRHCARNGKLIELVDQSIQSLDKEQALLCIKVALLCLLKSPARRPSMKEVVGMLGGELQPPQLPVEYSPSTPSRLPFKSRKKGG